MAETSQTLQGAGKKFTITGELKPFGKSDDGEFIDSRIWNNEIQIKVFIKRPSAGFDDYFWSPENVAVVLNPYVGKNVTLDLLSDQVKDGKPEDEKYWNYYCTVTGRHNASPQQVTAAPQASQPETSEPEIPGFNPSPFPECAGEIQGHLEKLAVELYVGTEDFGDKDYDEIILDIRRLRDQLFHGLKTYPPAPLHYCYRHERSRDRSKKSGMWGHPTTDGSWCLEGGTPTPDPKPDLSPEGFLASMEAPEPPPPLDEVDSLFDEGGF